MLRTCRAEQRLRLETRTHTKCLLPMKFQDSTIRLVYNGVQKIDPKRLHASRAYTSSKVDRQALSIYNLLLNSSTAPSMLEKVTQHARAFLKEMLRDTAKHIFFRSVSAGHD